MKINRKRILWMLLGVIFILSGCAEGEEAPQTAERLQVETKAKQVLWKN